jgi:hypothetical protein
MLLQSYKERLGQVENVTSIDHISTLLTSHQHLDFLEEPFTPNEIDDVVAYFSHN